MDHNKELKKYIMALVDHYGLLMKAKGLGVDREHPEHIRDNIIKTLNSIEREIDDLLRRQG